MKYFWLPGPGPGETDPMSAAREGTMSGHAPRPLPPAPDTGLSSITEADRELPPPPPGDILQGENIIS